MVARIKENFHLNGDKETANAVKKLRNWAGLIVILGGLLSYLVSGVTYKVRVDHAIADNAAAIEQNGQRVHALDIRIDESEEDFEMKWFEHNKDQSEQFGRINANLGILLERTAP